MVERGMARREVAWRQEDDDEEGEWIAESIKKGTSQQKVRVIGSLSSAI